MLACDCKYAYSALTSEYYCADEQHQGAAGMALDSCLVTSHLYELAVCSFKQKMALWNKKQTLEVLF